jgi:predicted hydrocarbon binding protein
MTSWAMRLELGFGSTKFFFLLAKEVGSRLLPKEMIKGCKFMLTNCGNGLLTIKYG